MKMMNFAGLATAAVLLAGCAGTFGQYSVDALNKAEPTGDKFTAALTKEYRDLANFEWAKMMDWKDGAHFAKKGLAAAAGDAVAPDMVDSRDEPAFAVADLTDGYTRLTTALEAGARKSQPEVAGRAQAMFDCWLEQQEENHQPDDIAACRKDFEEAMLKLGNRYMVFFDFGKAELTAEGLATVKMAAATAKAGKGHVTLVGHADTVGNAAANAALSARRAAAVKSALVKEGLKSAHIHTSAKGETKLMVPTKDNVKEQSNRRTEILVK